MAAEYKLDYGAAQQAIAGFDRHIGAITDFRRDVQQTIDNLQGNWNGDSYIAFAQMYQSPQYTQVFQNLTDALERCKQELETQIRETQDLDSSRASRMNI